MKYLYCFVLFLVPLALIGCGLVDVVPDSTGASLTGPGIPGTPPAPITLNLEAILLALAGGVAGYPIARGLRFLTPTVINAVISIVKTFTGKNQVIKKSSP